MLGICWALKYFLFSPFGFKRLVPGGLWFPVPLAAEPWPSVALLPRDQHPEAAGAGRAELPLLLLWCQGHPWVLCISIPAWQVKGNGEGQGTLRDCPPGSGCCAHMGFMAPCIPAQSVPTEPRCFASRAPWLPGILYLGEGGVTKPITAPEGMMSPEQVLWGTHAMTGGLE